MATDNESLTVQQEAMASEATGSTPVLQTDTTEDGKVRKSPYYNCANAILAMVTHISEGDKDETPAGLLQKWQSDTDVSQEVRDAVCGALSFLVTKITTFRDEPRDEGNVPGSWYVGINGDGARVAFKSASVPSEKSVNFQKFKIVLGKFHTESGANYCANKGRRAKDVLVFHRKGTDLLLGARLKVNEDGTPCDPPEMA